MLMIAGHYRVPAEHRKGFVEAPIRVASISPSAKTPSILPGSKPPKTKLKLEMGTVQKHHISHSEPPF
jgi:hypothetical protein